MALPTTREEFAEYCLAKLGKPVINIEVSNTQIEHCIDDALQIYRDHHYDASSKVYYRHQVTAQDKTRKYIPIPTEITGITKMFDITHMSNAQNIFDIRYQIALNDLYTLTQQTLVPYFMTMQHLAFIEQILVGSRPIRFQRHMNRLYIDTDWNTLDEGIWIVVEAWQNIDPEDFEDVWSDRWLLRYATVLLKKQWGSNLKKFSGIAMPGGVTFNGQQLYDEAEAERIDMEEKLINDFSYPLGYEIG